MAIAEADRLIPEDLLSGTFTDEWVRTPAYKEGHRVSVVGHSSWCGLQLVLDEQWWESFQAYLKVLSGQGKGNKGKKKWMPRDWYIAIDRRVEDSHCTDCRKKDLYAGLVEDPTVEVVVPITGDYSPFVDPTPAEQLEYQRFLTKVMFVARELGATVEAA